MIVTEADAKVTFNRTNLLGNLHTACTNPLLCQTLITKHQPNGVQRETTDATTDAVGEAPNSMHCWTISKRSINADVISLDEVRISMSKTKTLLGTASCNVLTGASS